MNRPFILSRGARHLDVPTAPEPSPRRLPRHVSLTPLVRRLPRRPGACRVPRPSAAHRSLNLTSTVLPVARMRSTVSPGMGTIHANSAREAITKMCTLPLLAGETYPCMIPAV